MKPFIRPRAPSRGPRFVVSRGLSLAMLLVVPAPFLCALPQEPPQQAAPSIAEAARNARKQKSNPTEPKKVISNDDLIGQSLSMEASSDLKTAAKKEPVASETSGCSHPTDAERLQAELQSAQDERDRLRAELAYQPTIISGGNLDLGNFKPGSSGLNVGAPPLLNSQPVSPERVEEGALSDKIASLTQALQIACAPPEKAAILSKLDPLKKQLNWLQRQFALDQNAYYAQTNYAQDSAGKARLDAEQEHIASLQSEIERLTDELSTSEGATK